MSNLSEDLELLRKLNESRRCAIELREQALRALKRIELDTEPNGGGEPTFKYKDKGASGGKNTDQTLIIFESWVAPADDIERALLVKIQSHRELSKKEKENNNVSDASPNLNKRLKELKLGDLLEQPGEASNKSSFPVLLAARAMQALVTRARTVFDPTTMRCYYRIIRELYGVAHPNWTVGAARAGVGGTTSAFVTNECVRAIFAFERSLQRTCKFFEETLKFYRYFASLEHMREMWSVPPSGPLGKWIDKSIEARWLDCQIATNPRNREMALFPDQTEDRNTLLLPEEKVPPSYISTGKYFDLLQGRLQQAVDQLCKNIEEVRDSIDNYRKIEKKEADKEKGAKEEQYNRSATGHLFAFKIIKSAAERAGELQKIVEQGKSGESNKDKNEARKKFLEKILKKLAEEFYKITRSVHHVLRPSKQYLKWVLDRELAAPSATFDAGELVFAATSYGAIQKWRLDDRLTRACELLINSLPENGRLATKRPFHADRRGYRTIPIGCEMTRALATLMQKTAHRFDAKFVARMLGVFQEQLIELHESSADKTLIGWNFEGAPDPDKPAVWVTAVSILALDRIVRMLNTRINEIVLAHFDVTKPERPHTKLTLRHLIYSDYGLIGQGPVNRAFEGEERLTAIHLQKARAHVMRATLPARYREDNKNFSTIYYGPPRTGKTTLAEALALSARVPVLRLSPGDLILQGQELIEGRAHDVFEALSMVTQCVIIFDEFEPVLKNRGSGSRSTKKGLARMGDILEDISEKEDPKFRFVLGGMLPKLIKLHDSAKKQSFVYCLGTNYLRDIDDAAKREGRFDKKIPVYKPDALSRAGALLYWLGLAKKDIPVKDGRGDSEFERFHEIIAQTAGDPADRISKLLKSEKNEEGNYEPTETLKYILGQVGRPRELKRSRKEIIETLKEELLTKELLDKYEKEEAQRKWICKYEIRVVKNAKNVLWTSTSKRKRKKSSKV